MSGDLNRHGFRLALQVVVTFEIGDFRMVLAGIGVGHLHIGADDQLVAHAGAARGAPLTEMMREPRSAAMA